MIITNKLKLDLQTPGILPTIHAVQNDSYSRNLEKPVEKVKTGRVSKGSVCKMATQRIDDSEYWEKRYKGYRFVRCYSRYNEYNGHWYVSVVMYRTEDLPPQWDVPDWITEDGA